MLTKEGVFGCPQCWLYSIEWQKRGLPHAHILLWLKMEYKIRATDIDSVISSELPNPNEDPDLFAIVAKQMVHGPCGPMNPCSPCMKDSKCTKGFPKQFIQDTQTDHNGYPLYRRRKPNDGGFTAQLRVKQAGQTGVYDEVQIDNRWVVPYNKFLCRAFNAHINVELCMSIKSIQYVLKYINKGCDMATFAVQDNASGNDEIARFQTGRYVSASEACWRIFDFPVHARHPAVVPLAVHLENGQRVFFTEDNVYERIQEPPQTTLTAYFNLCQSDAFAQLLLYPDVPKFYTWDKRSKSWKRRVRGSQVKDHPNIRESDTLGRVYTVHPRQQECFYLRLLLHTVKGAKSFKDLKEVDGKVCDTFREACRLRGLLEDDTHWHKCLDEAAAGCAPSRLRSLFAIILTMGEVADLAGLWMQHCESMCADILFQSQQAAHDMSLSYSDTTFNEALLHLDDMIRTMGGKELSFYGLPNPTRTGMLKPNNKLFIYP